MIAERGMRRSLAAIVDRFFLEEASATSELPSQSLRDLLLPLLQMVSESDSLRADSLGYWRSGGDLFFLPRFVFQRTEWAKPRIKVGIFVGLHGDAPGGILGLIRLIRTLDAHPSVGREYQLWLYPVCNPSGYADGTRQSRGGRDLNREFWKNSAEPEVQLLERELQGHRFNGIISLHCDDVSDGVRGFVNGSSMSQYLLKPALAAAERALPSNAASRINGFHALNGSIASRENGAFQAPPEQKAAPFEIALEVPQRAPLQLQAHAFLFALHEILASYRRISFADEA
jgi:murein peptide amidase A